MANFNDSQFLSIVRNEDFVVTDHVLHGVRTMPGVTFIDMIYRVCLEEGISLPRMELRNVLFKEPVVTSDLYDKKIEITLKAEDGVCQVTARSQKVKGDQTLSPEWADHFSCELHPDQGLPQRTINPAELKAKASRVVPLEESYAFGHKVGLTHRDLLKLQGDVFVTDEYVLAEVDLTPLGREYRDQFYLHPAYLDGALNVARIITIYDQELSLDKLFIPMYVGTFQALERIQDVCYVHIRRDSVRLSPSQDISYADFDIYDKEGRLVAYYKNFGAKQVRSEELIQGLQRLGNERVSAATPAAVTAPTPVQAASAATETVSLEAHLRTMVGDLLNKRPEAVDPTAGFYDQGLDSSALLKLVQKLEAQLGEPLYPTLLFEYTNIRELAGYLEGEYGGTIAVASHASSQNAIASQAIANTAASTTASTIVNSTATHAAANLSPEEAIARDLQQMVGDLLNKSAEAVDLESGFYDQGLDSSALLKLVQRLEAQLGEQLYPTLLFEYTNIKDLAEYLASEFGANYRPTATATAAPRQEKATEVVYLRRSWESVPFASTAAGTGTVLVLDTTDALQNALQSRLGNDTAVLVKPGANYRELGNHTYEIQPDDAAHYRRLLNDLQARGLFPTRLLHRWVQEPFSGTEAELLAQRERGVGALLFLTQALMEHKPKEKIRLLYTYAAEPNATEPLQAAVSGFARSLSLENPKFSYKTLEVGVHTSTNPTDLTELALCEWQADDEVQVRYESGQRLAKRLTEASPDKEAAGTLPLKNGGVYLLTGGAGGLGLLFAKHLASQVQATIVLTGRSELNDAKQQQVQELESMGSEVLYLQADVTKREDVEALAGLIREQYGRIDGIIHSAGVIRDAFVLKKTKEEMDDVLAAKVQAVVHLDEVLAEDSLDFVVYFSSVASMIGNAGQSDYAYGNSFLDHFAARREELRRQGQRSGRTISINWPLWRDGGMRVDEQKEAMIFEKTGIVSLSTENGLGALADAFRCDGAQVLVLEGEKGRILQGLNVANQVTATVTTTANAVPSASVTQSASATQFTTATPTYAADEDIAVIGVSGRYPQSRNLDEFWLNLKNGRNCVTEIPKDRWNHDDYYDPNKDNLGKSYAKWGGFIEDADKFDALFFNISPREAVLMDPQERLFLQTSWETLEDAGYTRDALATSRVGVFVGVMWAQYQLLEHEIGGKKISPTSIYASVANRISYFFNFTGPSVALDTMCSSSLTSLHFACESIRRGESDLAIAGGVNLSIHPNKYLFLSTQRFASSDGTCKSFGDGGDGYVPGEGVGAVLLKPLSKAIADGDQIHAVIKATAINAGGKSSGYAVPSPVAQANVVADAFKKANLDPRTISYIEAHGTGTALGDPIEINGLKKAFGKQADKQFCSIGSVKSSIGHLESAAGIAAITKVLLQLRHGQIAPSLHSATLNPQIPFADSPFYVQQHLQDWKRPLLTENGVATEIPRRAGVSSFGAGGSNAHILMEEHRVPTRFGAEQKGAAVIVLSARAEDRLTESAKHLHAYIERLLAETPSQEKATVLRDIAFTLQTGREAMEARLAFTASSLDEVAEKLNRFLQNGTSAADVYVANTDEVVQSVTTEQVAAALQTGNADELARLWANGGRLDWTALYNTGGQPYRVSLPTYPFTPERYWVNTPATSQTAVIGGANGMSGSNGGAQFRSLHPLVDVNESTLEEQTFRKTLHVSEFFIKDHIVSGQLLLPGAAYLEMVRVAGSLAAAEPVTEILDVIWAYPVAVQGETHDLYVSFFPEQGEVHYEVFSKDGENKIVHSQGKVGFASVSAVPDRIDIAAVKSRSTLRLQREEVYGMFRQAGFDYGPTFQVTDELYGGGREGLVKLSLPQELQNDFAAYGLHPSLLDGTFRAIAGIGFVAGQEKPVLRIPFSLGRLELLAPITEVCYAYATTDSALDAEVVRYEIKLLNEAGDVLARLTDFSTRLYKENGVAAAGPSENMLYYRPSWNPAPLAIPAKDAAQPIVLFAEGDDLQNALANGTILVQPGTKYEAQGNGCFTIDPANANDYHRLFNELATQGITPSRLVHAWSLKRTGAIFENVPADLNVGLYSIMHLFKAITARKLESKTRCLFLFPHASNETAAVQEAVAGFANSLTPVNHRFELVSVQVDGKAAATATLAEIVKGELAQSGNGTEVRHANGERFVRALHQMDEPATSQVHGVKLRARGVYLITGGAGGLGMIFAEHLAKHAKARLILTGRSELSQEKLAEIEALKARYGADVLYVRGDVANPEDVAQIVAAAKNRYGALHGIFHSAGITGDKLVLDADTTDFAKVLGPKMHGTLNLDRATAGEESLELFVLFSSISALVGDFGGCSYAAGNTFLDRFAKWRDERRAEGKRHGRTLSVNWPLWKGGGLELPADEAEVYYEYSGMRPMTVQAGLDAFDALLGMDLPQVVVVCGDAKKVNRVLKVVNTQPEVVEEEAAEEAAATDSGSSDADRVFQAVELYLKQMLSRITDLPVERIKSRAALEKYGIDSVMIMEINNQLEKDFRSLPKTLLFEYGNLFELATYFTENHADRVRELCGVEKDDPKAASAAKSAAKTTAKPAPVTPLAVQPKTRSRFAERQTAAGVAATAREEKVEEIAIIGVSGRYPQANDLDEFWDNLKNGRDCITEIPADRWEYRKYFDPKKGVKGKTYSKWGGFISEADKFDSLFFSISPREADTLDPQERVFMETAWQTIEDAGYTRNSLATDRVGVFVGVMYGPYQLHGVEQTTLGNPQALASMYSSVANRVSYFMNFNGPSVAVDTACSSALEAIRLACQNILSGACDVAIAGGVNLSLHPQKYMLLSAGHFLASDGRCHSFGDGGDGYVPGEGVGAVLLKPLSKAIADGDHIYAVVKAATVNHGGKTNGYSVPNPNAQASLIADALKQAKVDARTVSFIEAHGTGTSLGDPIEVTGLTKAFREFTQDTQFCSLGSAKSNIGHLESAAGIASVTKVLLQMKHKQLAPSLHAKTLNPNIDFASTPFYVQQELAEWKRPVIVENGVSAVAPRRAGVSGFGAGGTNVHLLLEEYEAPETAATGETTGPQLIVLSARNEERLKASAGQLLAHLRRSFVPSVHRHADETALAASLTEELAALAAAVLNIGADEIEAGEGLLDYGFEAVTLTELAGRVNERWGLGIAADVLAESGTIEAVAARLAAEHGTELLAHYPTCVIEVQTGDVMEQLDLADVAYTLQTGREEMDERLAVVASSVQDVVETLQGFVDGKASGSAFRGSTKSKGGNDLLLDGEEGEEFLQKIIERGKMAKLAQLWVNGAEIEWNLLYSAGKPRRISLPGYAFARTRHWFKGAPAASTKAGKALHPLLDSVDVKGSLQAGVVFKKSLSASDALLDANLQGQTVFPELAALELAAAGASQLRELAGYAQAEVVWLEPLALDGEKLDVKIAFQAGADDTLAYEIQSVGVEGVTTTHVFGEFRPVEKHALQVPLADVQARCSEVLAGADLYARLAEKGDRYGDGYQVIGELHGSRAEALATVVMSPAAELELATHTLHPAWMAGVMQAVTALDSVLIGNQRRQIFVAGAVEHLQKLPASGHVLVQAAGAGRYNAYVTDAAGVVCVVIRDLALRAPEAGDGTKREEGEQAVEVVLATAASQVVHAAVLGTQVAQATQAATVGAQVAQTAVASSQVAQAAAEVVAAVAEVAAASAPAVVGALAPVAVEPVAPAPTPVAAAPAPITAPAPSAQPSLSTTPAWDEDDRRDFIEDTIIDAVVGVLQMDRADFDPSLPHIDFGVDSILAIEIVNRINDALGLQIKPTELFNYPTVSKMAEWLFADMDATISYPESQKEAK
jgi:acyl transferase domain-containing protein/acyl carrier protein